MKFLIGVSIILSFYLFFHFHYFEKSLNWFSFCLIISIINSSIIHIVLDKPSNMNLLVSLVIHFSIQFVYYFFFYYNAFAFYLIYLPLCLYLPITFYTLTFTHHRQIKIKYLLISFFGILLFGFSANLIHSVVYLVTQGKPSVHEFFLFPISLTLSLLFIVLFIQYQHEKTKKV